jgi:hypothetical protein
MKRRAIWLVVGCRSSILRPKDHARLVADRQLQADQKISHAFAQWAFARMTGVRLCVWQRSNTLTVGADQLTNHIFFDSTYAKTSEVGLFSRPSQISITARLFAGV